MSPYEMVFGQRAVLPLDIEFASYIGVDWDSVRSRKDLLVARAEHLIRREEFLEVAHNKMMKARTQGVKYWDKKMAHKLRKFL